MNFPHERFERSIAEFQTKHASHEADSKHANEFVYSNEQHLQLQTRETINLISLHAQQLFPQQTHNAQLKAYGDATQKLCEAAHVLNNEGMFDQAEAASFFADSTIKAGKAIINDAKHIPGSSDIALVYDENVHYMRLHRVYECLTDMSDIMKDDLFNAWQEFKHQPTTGKILNVANSHCIGIGILRWRKSFNGQGTCSKYCSCYQTRS